MPHLKVRRPIDTALDRLRYRFDTFPKLAYQPLPQVGRPRAKRDGGAYSRWAQIESVVDELKPATCLDIGSQVGFFAFSLAERGVPTVAVEMEPKYYRTLLHVAKRLDRDDLGVLVMKFTPGNGALLPSADAVVFLSVWHHLVRWYGMEDARAMLRTVWAKTGMVMFFETGENEMPAHYGLPDMGPDASAWVTNLLEAECPQGTVRVLGRHRAFDPEDNPCERNLFAVVRQR